MELLRIIGMLLSIVIGIALLTLAVCIAAGVLSVAVNVVRELVRKWREAKPRRHERLFTRLTAAVRSMVNIWKYIN